MYPKLRAIEIIPFRQAGKDAYALRDPAGFAENTLVVSPPVIFILQRLDGRNDLESIRKEFEIAARTKLPPQQLAELVSSLDTAHFLESESFHAHRDDVIRRFRSAASRAPGHAGQAYPEQPDRLREWFRDLEPNDAAPYEPSGHVVGAAAPHIDCRFGGASCRLVHDHLARHRADVDTLVVLGTGHCAGEDLFTLTRQRYATPLRTLETDTELVDALARGLGEEAAFAAEILHKNEHSIEFQAVFTDLAHDAGTAPRLLPVLVGSFHQFMETGVEPYSTPYVRRFVDTLREEIARLGRKAAFLASIDLSHLGPRYGDARGLTPEEAARAEFADRELLRFAEEGDAEGFFRHNQAAKDERRVCGFSALYMLLRLLPGARGTLLRYEQTTFPETEDTVAHCAMIFEQDGS